MTTKDISSDIDANNIITPSLEELSEDERRELEHERREFEKMQLMRYQKTRQGIIKKDGAAPLVFFKPNKISEKVDAEKQSANGVSGVSNGKDDKAMTAAAAVHGST
ncbi:hypothetical protein EJB05_34686, partial [Eragrostis curvula]